VCEPDQLLEGRPSREVSEFPHAWLLHKSKFMKPSASIEIFPTDDYYASSDTDFTNRGASREPAYPPELLARTKFDGSDKAAVFESTFSNHFNE
jgi:hypothetical protein